MRRRISLLLISLCFIASCTKWVSACAPEAELLEGDVRRELESGIEQGEVSTFDHSTYGTLLAEHVDEAAGRIDYSGLKADRARLTAYLKQLGEADLNRLDRDAQMALLINAYNACTLELVLEHYPDLDSIRDISDPWGRSFCNVGGHELTLDEIEHNLIRPLYRDERIHFAVNCASVGCPPLADEPYTGPELDDQLERAAERTIRRRRYARVENDTLHLNPILNWYRSDFLNPEFRGHAETLPAWVARYADDSTRQFIEQHDGEPPVEWMSYDWSLNDSSQ